MDKFDSSLISRGGHRHSGINLIVGTRLGVQDIWYYLQKLRQVQCCTSITLIMYRVTHKGWDFRVGCTEFILPRSLYDLNYDLRSLNHFEKLNNANIKMFLQKC